MATFTNSIIVVAVIEEIFSLLPHRPHLQKYPQPNDASLPLFFNNSSIFYTIINSYL